MLTFGDVSKFSSVITADVTVSESILGETDGEGDELEGSGPMVS